MNRWKLAVGGVAAIMAGGGLLGAYAKLAEKGSELVHVQEQMRVAGMRNQEIAAATAKSWELTRKYQNVGVTQVAEIIAETRLPYGSTEHAIKFAEPAVQFASLMRATLGNDKGEKASDEMFQLVRSAEMRNIAMDPAKLQTFFDDAAKIVEAFKGKQMPHDIFQQLKYARTNTPYLSERFVTRIMPSLALEMGSSSAGTALTSFSQEVVAGKMNKRAAEFLEQIGMIDKKDVLKTTTTQTILRPGAVKGWQLAATDPDLWASGLLMQHMLAHGYTDPMKQRLGFGIAFGNRTAENFANILGTPASIQRLNKDAAMIDEAHGLKGAKELLENDPTAAMQRLRTSFHNLLVALGAPQVGTAVAVMNNVANSVSGIADWASKHQVLVAGAGKAMVVIGAFLVGAGTVAVVAAGVAAVAAGGTVAIVAAIIAGIGAAVAAFLAMDWGGISKGLKSAADAVGGFFSRVWNVVRDFLSHIPGVSMLPGLHPDQKAPGPKPPPYVIEHGDSTFAKLMQGQFGGAPPTPPPARPAPLNVAVHAPAPPGPAVIVRPAAPAAMAVALRVPPPVAVPHRSVSANVSVQGPRVAVAAPHVAVGGPRVNVAAPAAPRFALAPPVLHLPAPVVRTVQPAPARIAVAASPQVHVSPPQVHLPVPSPVAVRVAAAAPRVNLTSVAVRSPSTPLHHVTNVSVAVAAPKNVAPAVHVSVQAQSSAPKLPPGLGRPSAPDRAPAVPILQTIKVQTTANLNIDGRKLASIVSEQLAHQMTGPRATARPDTRAAFTPKAAGYSY